MPLEALQAKRDAILGELARVGDMRKGSITETFRACGKPSCACSAPDHPGHGPYYAFTTKVAGKTRSVQLRPGSRLAKFEREVNAYKSFRSLSEELLKVNEALCNARREPPETSERSASRGTWRGSSRGRWRKK